MRQSEILQHVFPALRGQIAGGNYPPAAWKELVAEVLGWSQFAGIILIFFGERIFSLMGIPQPEWNIWMRDNKLMTGLGIMFVGNLGQQLRATGAFEVIIHGETVFSRLASGSVPLVEDIVDVLIARGYTPIADHAAVLEAIHNRIARGH